MTQTTSAVPATGPGLRVAFVTDQDPQDVTGWSGINYFMSRALAAAGCELVPFHGFKRSTPVAALAKKIWAKGALGKYYEIARHPAVMRDYARQVEGRLAAEDVAAVFSTGTHLTADCRTKAPLFFWADATVPALFALYPGYDKYWRVAYREALDSERRAVRNATAMFFSSEWAAESAVRELGAEPSRVHVVPFGANFITEPAAAAALVAARDRPRDRVVLLFAGVDWKRKGGTKALAVAAALAARGRQVELHILGVNPPEAAAVRGGSGLEIHWHGRISKETQEGGDKIASLFARAHFFLLPTIGDCTPMVFAEANAYAVPVVTHRLGGIPTMIRDGLNGRLFSPDASPDEQAGWMYEAGRDPARYLALAQSSRAEYEARLNWRQAASQVLAVVRHHLQPADRAQAN